MKTDDARALLESILGEIAPEVDFLHLVEAIYARSGVNVAESDYWRLSSLNACVAYLAAAPE